MKKVLLTLALAAFAFTANAQWVIGGNIGIDHTNNHANDYTIGSTSGTDFSIMPKIGYWLNDDMQVGAQLGYNYNYNRNYTNPAGNVDDYTSNTGSAIVFAPYLRYNVAKWNNFTVFCEGQLRLTLGLESHNYNSVTGNTLDLGDSFTQFGINIIPGLNYAINEKISLDLYVHLLGIHANFMTNDAGGSHSFGFGVDAGEQTIQAHLANFGIGFNYAL